LPSITEAVAINDSLLIYNRKTDEPIEVTYAPDDPNLTFRELREALPVSEKFAEAKIDEFIDCFGSYFLRLETGWQGFKKCVAKAKSLKTLDLKEVFYK
jgi:hypothetical protein